MPEDLLELEAPAEEEPIEGEQPAEGADAAEQPVEGEEQQPEVTSLFDADGKKVAKPIREMLAKLKTDNPSIAKIVTDAVYRTAELRREFPGGVAEARELRDGLEELGGLDGVRESVATAKQFQELSTAFDNGNPAFVDDMVESNPEAFATLAPMIFDRFRELNAEAWCAYLGRIVYGDIQSNDIPLCVMRLADLISDKPAAVELLGTINKYLGGFKTLADKQPVATKPPARTAAKPAEATKENDLRAREWNLDRKELSDSTRTEAYTKALAGRTVTAEQRVAVEKRFRYEAAELANAAFPGWSKKSQQYIASNNKEGYLRYMRSIYKRVFPEAMATAVQSANLGKAKPTAAQKTAPGVTAKPAEGFTMVAKEPGSYDIDYDRTSSAMLRENKAFLTSGKKVQWR